jgi:hypothetical protein
MKSLKERISAPLLAATLAATLNTATPAPQAQAGVILAPVAVGIALIVLGIHYHNRWMIILDADGNIDQASLEKGLSQKYSFIDNTDVIRNLAASIREKAASTAEVDGTRMVRLSRSEVLSILAPTGLAELNPSAVDALIQDLE